MADEVYMDIPAVEKMVNTFQTFGEVLDAVAKTLEALSIALKATAVLTLGGSMASAAYIDRIKPNFKKAADKMREISVDIRDAIKAYRDGDLSGSSRFMG